MLPATSGHFDELLGHQARAAGPTDEAEAAAFAGPWADFFKHLGSEGLADLDHREASLKRQIRDNGVTYNVYADASGPQRPWSLDLFPLIISPESWQQIEAGVLQRVRVLDRVMADVTSSTNSRSPCARSSATARCTARTCRPGWWTAPCATS